MAKVKVTSDHVVYAKPNVSVLYRAGSTVTAPRAHIEEIVAAGRGERIGGDEIFPALAVSPSDIRPIEASRRFDPSEIATPRPPVA